VQLIRVQLYHSHRAQTELSFPPIFLTHGTIVYFSEYYVYWVFCVRFWCLGRQNEFVLNFDPTLACIITETKYLEQLGFDIPALARNIALQVSLSSPPFWAFSCSALIFICPLSPSSFSLLPFPVLYTPFPPHDKHGGVLLRV